MLLKLCLVWLTASCCDAYDFVNMALNKPTRQSSTNPAFTFVSALVDGRVPGGDITEFMTCIHTSENPRDENPWWQVDLGHVYPVVYISIYGRPRFIYRMVDTEVTIDNHTCFSVVKIPSTNSFHLSCNTALTGRIVRVSRNSRNRQDTTINMCEVQVWVCKDGKYGANCGHTCGQCKGETCDKASGRCPRGCDPGWQGQRCDTVCKEGKYGATCSHTCGQCKGETCDKASGRCPRGCDPGWQGQRCDTGCRDGEYGWTCSQSCGHCANSSACDKVTGRCPSGCVPGWTSDWCQTACEDGMYGWNCSQSCDKCSNFTCDKVTGRCVTGCQAGWTGALCQTACEDGMYGWNCSQSCDKCSNFTCDKVTGRCVTGCQAGWTGAVCQTGGDKLTVAVIQ